MKLWIAALALTFGLSCVTFGYAQSPPAVSSPTEQPATSTDKPKLELQKKTLGQMRPVHALGDIYLAGQPSPADLDLLKQAGIETIISVRNPKEVPWDEAAEVSKRGMKFVEVPFQGADQLKPAVFDKLRKTLLDEKRGPTVFHCGSANRVGAVWYAHRVLDDDLSPQAALEEAKIVGLRTPAYFERAQQYIAQEQAKAASKAKPQATTSTQSQ